MDTSVNECNNRMAQFQFISHYLVCMLPMSFTKMFVKHKSMDNGKASIYAVHQKEDKPGYIFSSDYQQTYCKQKNEGHTYTTHVAGEALRLSLRTEAEEAEHKY